MARQNTIVACLARSREVLAIANLPSESPAGWSELLLSLKDRGLTTTDLVIADGLPGMDQVVHKTFPGTRH